MILRSRVKALVQADIDVDEIYYARQDLEKILYGLGRLVNAVFLILPIPWH